MCGIVGIFDREGNHSKEELYNLTKAMCSKLSHRGPDDEGVWISEDGYCALGHRRLSIIDLSTQSHQPIEGNYSALTYNGEIYNYIELSNKLNEKGINCSASSDTRTLLTGLDNFGTNFITELDGMYAFAYYNQKNSELIITRDPFGEKPLYYTVLNGAFIFASEIGAFNALPEFEGEVSKDSVSLYLYFQYPPAPATIFDNVKKLSPATYKRVTRSREYEETRYFIGEFNGGAQDKDLSYHLNKLEQGVSESLERRLRSDVSLGAFLSGGIDSSTVVSLISQKFDRKIDTYSVGFVGSDKSEHDLANGISKALRTQHHTLMFDSADFVDYVDEIGRMDEPNGDTSCIPTYLVAKLASQDHKVALTGDGGDELFGGYSRYFRTIKAATGKELHIKNRQWHLGNEYVNSLNITPHKELRTLFGSFPLLLEDTLLTFRREIDLGTKDYLSRFRQLDLTAYLPTVLAKVDRMSMCHSLEARTPFLSSDVFNIAANIPNQYLYDGNTSKNILRSILQQYLPSELIQKQKIGFSFLGENEANARALKGLVSKLHDELRSIDSFLNKMFGEQKMAELIKDLPFLTQSRQLQLVWSLLLLNSFMNNCRYKFIS